MGTIKSVRLIALAPVAIIGCFTIGKAYWTGSSKDLSESSRRRLERCAALNREASIARLQGNLRKAELAYQAVLRLAPKSGTPWAHLGDIYFDTGRFEKAYVAYDNFFNAPGLIDAFSFDLMIDYRYAKLSEQRGESAKALAAYRGILLHQDVVEGFVPTSKRGKLTDEEMAVVHAQVAYEYLRWPYEEEQKLGRNEVKQAIKLKPLNRQTVWAVAYLAGKAKLDGERSKLLEQIAAPLQKD